MKKIIISFIFINFIFINTANAAISEGFAKTLELMNIPRTNTSGYEINEEIYNKYNLFVYGKPQDVIKNQRWKDKEDGKWINESTGKRGEYRILGISLSGSVVNNEIFPDDYSSGKLPEEWEYIVIEDALSSWNDTEKYQTTKQYEYMLNQKLSRNGITYNLTAKDIGLDKARLETYATWKTAGSIFTLKYDDKGIKWGATFMVPPMAAEARLESKLNFPNGTTYKFEENSNILEIPLTYGAEVYDLSDYAKPEDIKSISSEIEVQYEIFDKIQNEKVTNILKDGKLTIDKNKYNGAGSIEIIVKNTSVLETYFSNEAPLVDIKEVVLKIILDEEEEFISVKDVNKTVSGEIPRPRIVSIKLYRQTVNNLNNKQNLYKAKKTNIDFICAGQVLIVEALVYNEPTSVNFYIEGNSSIQKLDNLTRKFVYDEPKARGNPMVFNSISALKASYQLPLRMKGSESIYTLEYIIPYGTKQTLHSWNTLRNETGNALEIDKSKLFNRISSPYKIKIRASNGGGTTTRSISLDVFERWDTIYNRDISGYVK